MIGALLALAVNTSREARRNRVTLVVVFFAIILLFAALLLTEATVATFERVLIDTGLGTLSFMLLGLAVFLSTTLLTKEVERRTVFMVMSRPLSRGEFVIGRFSGVVLTLVAILAATSVVMFLTFAGYGAPITSAQLIAIVMLGFELMVLSAVGFLLSSFAGQMVSLMGTVGIFIAGHLSADIYSFSGRSQSEAVRLLGKAVYYLLPNLERFNFRTQATYDLAVPLETLVKNGLYGFGYTIVVLSLAIAIFSRRDFK